MEGEHYYSLTTTRALIFGLIFPVLELFQNESSLHFKEPFDLINHVGNMGLGAMLTYSANLVILKFTSHTKTTDNDPILTERQFENTKFIRLFLSLVIVTLANMSVETKWGIEHLPIANWLHGTTPDPLDLIYSVGYSIIY